MQLRDAKRIWRLRRAAIQEQIRSLEKSPEQSSRHDRLVQRIIDGYRRERDRYGRLIHANDHSGLDV